MITLEERKKLKSILGTEYSKEVVRILKEKNIKNRNGSYHSADYVRKVFQGNRSNEDIESSIWELAAQRKIEIEELVLMKRKLLL